MPSDSNTWRIQVKGREQPKLVNKPTFAEDDKEKTLDKAVIDEKTKKLKDDLMEEAKNNQEKNKKEEVYSSGLESDNDLDLLVEQEVLAAIKMRKQLKKKLNAEKKDNSDSSSEDEETKQKPLDYDALKDDPEQMKQRGKKRKLTKD